MCKWKLVLLLLEAGRCTGAGATGAAAAAAVATGANGPPMNGRGTDAVLAGTPVAAACIAKCCCLVSSIIFCISVRELKYNFTRESFKRPPSDAIPCRASSSVLKVVLRNINTGARGTKELLLYLNAINASPRAPPTMCTPPSGMERPWKNWRISAALADHGKFCSRIMTLIFFNH